MSAACLSTRLKMPRLQGSNGSSQYRSLANQATSLRHGRIMTESASGLGRPLPLTSCGTPSSAALVQFRTSHHKSGKGDSTTGTSIPASTEQPAHNGRPVLQAGCNASMLVSVASPSGTVKAFMRASTDHRRPILSVLMKVSTVQPVSREGGDVDVEGKWTSPEQRVLFNGYFRRSAGLEDAELTHVGLSPGGEGFRWSWLPICMTEEFPSGPRSYALGEELVAFKDLSGRYGLVHKHWLAPARFARIRHRCGARYPLLLSRLAV